MKRTTTISADTEGNIYCYYWLERSKLCTEFINNADMCIDITNVIENNCIYRYEEYI